MISYLTQGSESTLQRAVLEVRQAGPRADDDALHAQQQRPHPLPGVLRAVASAVAVRGGLGGTRRRAQGLQLRGRVQQKLPYEFLRESHLSNIGIAYSKHFSGSYAVGETSLDRSAIARGPGVIAPRTVVCSGQ